MKSNKYKCKICDDRINPYNFFTIENMEEFFCSKECCKENYYKNRQNNYIHVSTCGGYNDCKKLNNITGKCRTTHEFEFSEI